MFMKHGALSRVSITDSTDLFADLTWSGRLSSGLLFLLLLSRPRFRPSRGRPAYRLNSRSRVDSPRPGWF